MIKPWRVSDFPEEELTAVRLLRGEYFSCILGIWSEELRYTMLTAENSAAFPVDVYVLRNAVLDFPGYEDGDDDVLTKEAGLMPDILEPVKDRMAVHTQQSVSSYYISFTVPVDLPAGEYTLRLKLHSVSRSGVAEENIEKTLRFKVLSAAVSENSPHYTQWFHVDCIAEAHHVPVYSEAHWKLIEEYMKAAHFLGVDTILTPVITPPLDTLPGTERLNTQLVKVHKNGENYSFDFALLQRFIRLAQSAGIENFEIAHLFSQWGLKCAPNIRADVLQEDGSIAEERIFGWDTPAFSEGYQAFLRAFLPELVGFLEEEGVLSRCFFHLSDEPQKDALDRYRKAHSLVKPYLKGRPILDAISDIEFYREGLIDCPVTATNHIEPFLALPAKNQWAYTCCGQYRDVGNRFLAMPSYRNRILGLQMYLFNVRGFLQWGFNYYHARESAYVINPYVTTSGDGAYPSGDAFSVYPGEDGPLYSLHGLVFKLALQDCRILKTAEERIGRGRLLDLVRGEAAMDISFTDYPRSDSFLPALMEKVKAAMEN